MASGYSSPTDGRELTREEVAAILVEPLTAASVVLAAGPNIFDSQGGTPLRIPKIDQLELSDPWRAENSAIAEEDPTFGEVELLPSSLKSVKVIHRVSRELIRHGVVGVPTALSEALVERVALVLDRAFLVGDGAADTVTGLAETTGVQTIPAVGSPDVDVLHDAELALLAANANTETAGWFMHPRDLVALRKQREGAGDGQYLVHPDPTEAGRYRLLGHPVHVTTQLPTDGGADNDESRIILADLSNVAVGRDIDPEVTFLTERYAEFDQIGIRVTGRWDIAPLNPEAVVVLEGVTA